MKKLCCLVLCMTVMLCGCKKAVDQVESTSGLSDVNTETSYAPTVEKVDETKFEPTTALIIEEADVTDPEPTTAPIVEEENVTIPEPTTAPIVEEADETDPEPTDAPNEEATDMYSCYYDLIDAIRYGLENGFTEEQINELRQTTGIEMVTYLYRTDPSHKTIGYIIDDLDGDGINELLLGENGWYDGSGVIFDVYTIENGEMLHTVMGWERNRYYLCENGLLANEGSSGAEYSEHRYYQYCGQVITSATETGLIERIFSNGSRDDEILWFYSHSVVNDEEAEPISRERAFEIIESYHYIQLNFTPFLR